MSEIHMPSRSLESLGKHTQPTKQAFLRHLLKLLRKQGFDISRHNLLEEHSYDKSQIRSIHSFSRECRLTEERNFIMKWFPRLSRYFASGVEVDPQKVQPIPVLVKDNEEHAALFRIATLWWSVPVS